MRFGLAVFSLLLLAMGSVSAQTETAAPAAETAPAAVPAADPFAATVTLFGELAAANPGNAAAGAEKASTCVACHSMDGNSVDPLYPKLAGQHEGYIARQLAVFKTGARPNPAMLPFVATLTAQDMRDLGAHFATLKPNAGKADDSKLNNPLSVYNGRRIVDIGESIYRNGVKDHGVPACMACHGPSGRGMPGPSYPSVGGQHASYTANILNLFKATKPGAPELNDPNYLVMAQVAGRLSDEEILAVSSYIQGLHAAAPGEHREAAAAAAVAAKP